MKGDEEVEQKEKRGEPRLGTVEEWCAGGFLNWCLSRFNNIYTGPTNGYSPAIFVSGGLGMWGIRCSVWPEFLRYRNATRALCGRIVDKWWRIVV